MVLTKGSQGSTAHTEVTETTRVGPLTEITPRGPQQAPPRGQPHLHANCSLASRLTMVPSELVAKQR